MHAAAPGSGTRQGRTMVDMHGGWFGPHGHREAARGHADAALAPHVALVELQDLRIPGVVVARVLRASRQSLNTCEQAASSASPGTGTFRLAALSSTLFSLSCASAAIWKRFIAASTTPHTAIHLFPNHDISVERASLLGSKQSLRTKTKMLLGRVTAKHTSRRPAECTP